MKDAAAKSERLVSGSVRKQVLSFALAAGGEGLWWAFVLSSALSAGVSLAVLYLRRCALLAAPPYVRECVPDKTR